MYKLIMMLFVAALMFGCSKEEAGDMMDKAGETADKATEHAGDAADKAKEHAGDAADSVKEHAGDAADSKKEMMNSPKVEPLPDWDSLPPIEDEAAVNDDSTMMEKAEEVVDKAKEHAGDAAESVKEHAGKAADSAKEMMKKE